jgi:hypothetical protein
MDAKCKQAPRLRVDVFFSSLREITYVKKKRKKNKKEKEATTHTTWPLHEVDSNTKNTQASRPEMVPLLMILRMV